MKILCIGQSAYDITLPCSEYPTENKKYKIKEVISSSGGSANNAAYLLGLWKSDVTLISPIGNDNYGKEIIEEDGCANTRCHFCNKEYFFSREELNQILDKI